MSMRYTQSVLETSKYIEVLSSDFNGKLGASSRRENVHVLTDFRTHQSRERLAYCSSKYGIQRARKKQ